MHVADFQACGPRLQTTLFMDLRKQLREIVHRVRDEWAFPDTLEAMGAVEVRTSTYSKALSELTTEASISRAVRETVFADLLKGVEAEADGRVVDAYFVDVRVDRSAFDIEWCARAVLLPFQEDQRGADEEAAV